MHIRALDFLNIIAIILGPIVALSIQRWSDDRKQSLARKQQIFKTLMMYRASRLNPNYVQSLNLIDVEFSSNREADKRVRTAWKVLMDHFNERQTGQAAAGRADSLTVELLTAMGKSLGYDFDPVHIKRNGYIPQAHVNIEEEQQALRKSLLDLLDGKRKVPVLVFEQKFEDVVLPDTTGD